MSEFRRVASAVRNLDAAARPRQKDVVLELLASDDELASSDIAVAAVLLLRLFWQMGSAQVSRLELEARTRRSGSSVQRAIRKLVERKHILVERVRVSTCRHAINSYTFPALVSTPNERGGSNLTHYSLDNF